LAFYCLRGHPVHFLPQGRKRNVAGGEEKKKLKKKKKDECERALNLCQELFEVSAI